MNPPWFAELKKALTASEGYRAKPYLCSAGKLTIGIGRNLEDRGITRAEAERMLEQDILDSWEQVKQKMPWCEGQSSDLQEVLVHMCFNLGINRLLGFKKALKAMEQQDWQVAAAEMLDSKWSRQVGKRAERLARKVEMIAEGQQDKQTKIQEISQALQGIIQELEALC